MSPRACWKKSASLIKSPGACWRKADDPGKSPQACWRKADDPGKSRGACWNAGRIRSPLACWRGGKTRLAKRLISLFPEHVCYAEPFAGAAWLLFRKEPSQVEVINDLDGEVANAFLMVRDHCEALAKKLRWAIMSRKIFNDCKAQRPEELSPLARAARFLYLLNTSFSGYGISFGYCKAATRGHLSALRGCLLPAHARLCNVYVENLDFAELIRRYDAPGTFFYVDPPYVGFEGDYRAAFGPEDLQRLADCLAGIRGKFLLSLNDCERARRLFGQYEMREFSVYYSSGNKVQKHFAELAFANYPLPETEKEQQ